VHGRRHRTSCKEGITKLEESIGAPPEASVEPRAEGGELTRRIVKSCAFAPTVTVGDRDHAKVTFPETI
jgi:hypothetical protein